MRDVKKSAEPSVQADDLTAIGRLSNARADTVEAVPMLSRLLSQVCPRILAPNHCASDYCAKPAKAAGRFAAAAADYL